MKISNQKYSLTLVSIALVLLSVLLVSFAKAEPIVDTSHPSISKPQIGPLHRIHASFTISPPKYYDGSYSLGELIKFTDKSTSLYSPIVSWDWDFGDGHHSKLKNPTHTYDLTTYSGFAKLPVTLKVKNRMGYTSTARKEINYVSIM